MAHKCEVHRAGAKVQQFKGAEMQRCRSGAEAVQSSFRACAEVQRCRGGGEVQKCSSDAEQQVQSICRSAGAEDQRCRGAEEHTYKGAKVLRTTSTGDCAGDVRCEVHRAGAKVHSRYRDAEVQKWRCRAGAEVVQSRSKAFAGAEVQRYSGAHHMEVLRC